MSCCWRDQCEVESRLMEEGTECFSYLDIRGRMMDWERRRYEVTANEIHDTLELFHCFLYVRYLLSIVVRLHEQIPMTR